MTAVIMTISAGNVYANPQDGVVSAGSATITSNGTTLNIHQSTHKAIIDWSSFDIGASETTQFYQPSSSSVTLNRVNSSSPSFIDGRLIANGNIFIVNQNGVVFGQNSKVDVNGLVASTADITNANFMAGNFRFDKAGHQDAIIENRGQITAGEAGLIGLVAPNVLNSGIIHAKMGRVQLASGDTATVDLYGDGLIEVAAVDHTQQRIVENTGKITAEGGTIAMTAAAGANMVNSLIRVSGELSAPAVGTKNGKIIIGAEGSAAVAKNISANKGKKSGKSRVIIDGTLDVSGKKPGEKGGTITVTADQIAVMGDAVLKATGSTGGGTIHIGGDYLGLGDTPTAEYTIIQTGSLIDASALDEGDGGEVIVFSEGHTEFGGAIVADGAGQTGDGGFVETSGKRNLLALGTVQLRAGRRGKAGTWLLDPSDITITASTNNNITGSPNFTANGTGSQVSAANIKSVLDAGTNVTILTSNDGYAGNGDIFVNSAITTTGNGALTLSAYRNIAISSAITLNGGSLTLRSDNTGIGSGAVVVNSSSIITTNGGNVTIGGGAGSITAGSGYAIGNSVSQPGVFINSNINAGGGNIIINGMSSVSSTNNIYGVHSIGAILTTGSGTISINGIARGSANASYQYGFYLQNTVSAVNGNISLTGTGGGAGGGSYNHGIAFASGGGLVRTTGTGNITVTGTGGLGSGGIHYGVLANNPSNNIQTTGSGNITVNGTGGTSSNNNNFGITVNGIISAAGGTITLNGTGGTSSGSGNNGVVLGGSTAGSITNTGTGTININGTAKGSSNSGSNFGVHIDSASIISTVNGALNVTGTGGGSGYGGYNYGIHVLNGTIRTTGTGAMTLMGTGGNNSGSGLANSGIFIVTGGTVQATGAGTISISGIGANSSGGSNGGISVQGNVTGAGGSITVTGTGGASSGSTNVGVRLNGGSINNSGNGTIAINGNGGGAGSSSANEGVILQNGGNISTANGALTVNGTGGNGSGGSHNGITVTTTAASTVKTTGSGILTLNGTTGAISGYGVNIGLANGVQTTGTGSIRINTDSINANTASAISSIGSLTLSSITPGLTMGFGSGLGALSVDDTLLGYLNAASYVFGATTLGNMDIHSSYNFGDKNVSFISGGNINLSSTLTKSTGAGAANYLFQANNNITNSNAAGLSATSGQINLTMTSDNDVSGAGNITLDTAPLTVNGGTITLNSNGQSITQSGIIGGHETINSANGAVNIGILDADAADTRNLTINSGTGTFTTTDAIGSTTRFNNVTVTANDAVIGASINGSGTLTLRPTTTTRDLNVNYGTANGTNLHLNSTEISRIQGAWNQITIGRGNLTGDLNIGTSTFSSNVVFYSGTGGITIRDGATVSTTSLAAATFQSGGHVTLYGRINADGNITISNTYNNYLFASVGTGNTKSITSANGNITFNKGIDLYSAGASLSAVNGSIIFAGGSISGSNTMTATAKTFAFGSTVASGVGNITLNSTDSINIGNLTTAAGRTATINVTGAGNSITTTGNITTGTNGNINLIADDIVLGGNLSGTGTLNIKVQSSDRAININSGTSDGTHLNLSSAELNYIQNGWSNINIGDNVKTGIIRLGATSWYDPVTFTTRVPSNLVYIDGAFTGLDNTSLSAGHAQIGANVTMNGGDIVINGDLNVTNNTSIVTNGGNFGVSNQTLLGNNTTLSISSSGGHIGLNTSNATGERAILGGNTNSSVILNAGSGNISLLGSNGLDIYGNLTASAQSIATSGSWGTLYSLGQVSLTSGNAITLPSINAENIFIQTIGSSSDITIGAGKQLSASGAGNAVTLVSGRNLINASGSVQPILLTGGGRWLSYSQNPSDDSFNGMTLDFVRYGCSYGSSCPAGVTIPSAGNGTVYVYRPTLTVTPTAMNAIYGDNLSLVGYSYATSGYLTGAAGNDSMTNSLTGTLTGSTNYVQGADVGTYNIDYASGSLVSSLGYLIAYTNNSNALTVGKRTLTLGLTGTVNRVYDGTNNAILSGSNYNIGNIYGSDASGLNILNVASAYNDKNVGNNKAVSVTGLSLTGSKAGNYQLASTTASANIGNISKKDLNVTGLNGVDRVYNGTTTAGLTGTAALSGNILGDNVLISATGTGSFADANVGIGKMISVSGFNIGGSDAGNYNVIQPSALTANVSKKTLTVTAGNQTMTYGDSVVIPTFGYTGFVAGEDVTFLNSAPTVTSLQNGIMNAGIYNGNFVISGGVATNYDFNYVAGNLTVLKKNLVVAANQQTISYGTAVPGTTTLVYTGFVNGEDSSVLDSSPQASSTLSGIQNSGTYIGNYVAAGGADNNYSFTYVGGDLVVTGGPIIPVPTPTPIQNPPILPNTYVYTFQKPIVINNLNVPTLAITNISYKIQGDENADVTFNSSATIHDPIYNNLGQGIIIGISPELAKKFSLENKDLLIF